MDDFKKENPAGEGSEWAEKEVKQEHSAVFSSEDGNRFSQGSPSGGEQENHSEFYSSYQGGRPPRGGGNGLKIFAVIVCVVLVLTLLVFTGYVVYKERDKAIPSEVSRQNEGDSDYSTILNIQSMPESVSDQAAETSQPEGKNELSTEDIAQKVQPSIVGIMVYTKDSAQQYQEYGSGSGIILSEDGYITTNAHVVLQENRAEVTPVDKIDVYLNNGEVCTAVLVGADPRTDLAVLKIGKNNLVAAEFGDSTALKVGEKAVAIGNPAGLTLAGSLTQGIISGVNRNITVGTSNYTMNCIQTDAAINPGNSGGALVNKYGQVVGINSSKIAQTDYEGIGFAIPVHEAQPVIDNLIANGYVANRVRIGITFTSIPESMGELMGVPAGLRVVSVDKTTDASQKGISAGDIITKIDGTEVVELEDVSAVLEGKKPGDTAVLTIYRATEEQNTFDVEVVLSEDTSGRVTE